MVTHRNGVTNGGKSGTNRKGTEEPGSVAGMPRSYCLVFGWCQSAMALGLSQPPGPLRGNEMPLQGTLVMGIRGLRAFEHELTNQTTWASSDSCITRGLENLLCGAAPCSECTELPAHIA